MKRSVWTTMVKANQTKTQDMKDRVLPRKIMRYISKGVNKAGPRWEENRRTLLITVEHIVKGCQRKIDIAVPKIGKMKGQLSKTVETKNVCIFRRKRQKRRLIKMVVRWDQRQDYRCKRRVNAWSLPELAIKLKKSGSHNDDHKEGKIWRGKQKRWTSAGAVFFEVDGTILLRAQRPCKGCEKIYWLSIILSSHTHLSNWTKGENIGFM